MGADTGSDNKSRIARTRALDAKLAELCRSDPTRAAGAIWSDLAAAGHGRAAEASRLPRRQLAAPVVHVFSSITHTMYIEVAELPSISVATTTGATVAAQERWQASSIESMPEREMAWMSEVE